MLTKTPDSPYGLRDDVIVQGLEAIRQSLRSNPSATPQGQAIASVSSTFGLTDEQSATLAGTLTVNGRALLTLLTAAPLTAQANDGTFSTAIDEATFPDQFAAYRLLHRVALVVTRHRLTDTTELAWLLAHASDAGVLQFGDLTAAGGFARWVALRELTEFRDAHPAPEGASLLAVLDAARANADVHTPLAALTGWTTTDLDALTTALGLTDRRLPRPGHARPSRRHLRDAPPPGRGRHPGARLGEPRRRRQSADHRPAGAPGGQGALRRRRLADDRHATVRLTSESPSATRSSPTSSSSRSAPNRPRSRSTASSGPTRSAGTTPTALLAWVLIDVEMCACQLTSRIKQAISVGADVRPALLPQPRAGVRPGVARVARPIRTRRTTGGSGSG